MSHITPVGALIEPIEAGIEPDAHGQAALLLAESILHALVETNVLTLEGARSAIQTTCEVKMDVAERSGESDKRMEQSLALLHAIAASFKVDAVEDADAD